MDQQDLPRHQQGASATPSTATHDALNAIVEELQSTSAKDKKTCMDALLHLLTDVTEVVGGCPMESLGQQVSCNLTILVIRNYVDPALKTKLIAKKCCEVSKALLQLLRVLHTPIPTTFKHQPLLWKNAVPLHAVFNHIAEVFESVAASAICAQDYAEIVQFLLGIDVYRSSITPRAIHVLALRFLDILQQHSAQSSADAAQQHLVITEVAREHVAAALACLSACPHFYRSLKQPTAYMEKLVTLAANRHREHAERSSSSFNQEMALLTTIRSVAAASLNNDKACALAPWRLLPIVLASWHRTMRRDRWRLEAVQFVSQQLAAAFSQIIHQAIVAEECDQAASSGQTDAATTRGNVGGGGGSDHNAAASSSSFVRGPCPPELMNRVIIVHSNLLPIVLSILSSTTDSFTFVSLQDIRQAPCEPLQPFFEFAALVLFIARITYGWYSEHVSVAVVTGNIDDDDVADQYGEPLSKKRRTAASPLDDVLTRVQQLAISDNEVTATMSLLWLHTLAVPMFALQLGKDDASKLSDVLLQFNERGSKIEQPLLAALRNIVPRASLATKLSIYSWATAKYVPCSGVLADDGLPSVLAYEMLLSIVESETASAVSEQQVLLRRRGGAGSGSGGSEEERTNKNGVRAQLLLNTTQRRCYHFTSSSFQHPSTPVAALLLVLRYAVNLSQLSFIVGQSAAHHQHGGVPPMSDVAVLELVLHCAAYQRLGEEDLNALASIQQDMAALMECRCLVTLQKQGNQGSDGEARLLQLLGQMRSKATARRIVSSATHVPHVVHAAIVQDRMLAVAPHEEEGRATDNKTTPLSLPSSTGAVGLMVSETQRFQLDEKSRDQLSQSMSRFLVEYIIEAVAQRSTVVVGKSAATRVAEDATHTTTPMVAMLRERSLVCDPKDVVACCALQLIYLTLNLRSMNVWCLEPGHPDGATVAQLVGQKRSIQDTCAALSNEGRIMFALQCCLEMVAARFASTSAMLHASLLQSTTFLLRSPAARNDLCSIDVGLWEPSQRILASIGMIGRSLLDGLGALCEHSTGRMVPSSSSSSSRGSNIAVDQVRAVAMICESLRHLFVTLRCTDIYRSASDPLIGPEHALRVTLPLLRSKKLSLIDLADRAAPATTLSFTMMECVKHILHMMIVLPHEEAPTAVLDAVETLAKRHAYSHLHEVFQLIAEFGQDSCPPWSTTTQRLVAVNCEELVASSRKPPPEGTLPPSPPLTSALETNIVTCIAEILGRCDEHKAVLLARKFFEFAGVSSCFDVRRAIANVVTVPFFKLPQVKNVLQELQVHVSDAIKSPEPGTCATALLALCNACYAAPQVEADVISFMLEFYATRDFHHKPLIIDALKRIAKQSFGSTFSGSHVALTRFHALRLLYDWVWRFRNPLEAIPAACFGYSHRQSMAADFSSLLLPVSLLHMKSYSDSSVAAASSSSNNPVVALIQMVCPNSGAVPLLREHFVHTIALLMLFQHGKYSTPCTKAHQDLSEAASFAIEWVTIQLGRELTMEMMKRNAEAIMSVMLLYTTSADSSTVSSTTSHSNFDSPSMSDIRGASLAAGHVSVSLPHVSFAVTSKAAASLVSNVGVLTIKHFFSSAKGSAAAQYMVCNLYYQCCSAPTALARCNSIATLHDVLLGWLMSCLADSQTLEHVLHTLCNILGTNNNSNSNPHSGGGMSSSRWMLSRREVNMICHLLRKVWSFVVSSSGNSNSNSTLDKHTAYVASTLEALSSRFVDVGRVLTDLRAADPHFQRVDWRTQESQLRTLSQSSLHEESEDGDAAHNSTLLRAGGDHSTKGGVLVALEGLSHLAGVPAAHFYAELAQTVDRDVALLVKHMEDDPVRTCAALRGACAHTHELASCTTTQQDIPVSTRTAAMDALRSLYMALLACKRQYGLEPILSAPFADEEQLSVLRKPETAVVQYSLPIMSRLMDHKFLDNSESHDDIIASAYAQFLVHVRELTSHVDAEVQYEAMRCLWSLQNSSHDVMLVARKQLEEQQNKKEGGTAAVAAAAAAAPFSDLFQDLRPVYHFYRSSLPLDSSTTAPSSSSGASSCGILVTDPSLWSLLPQQPSLFIRRFVCSLIDHYELHIKLDILKPLKSLALLCDSLAQSLLPVVFLHILMAPKASGVAAAKKKLEAWSSLIRDNIFKHVHENKTVTRVIIHSINTVKTALLSVVKKDGLMTDKRPVIKSATGSVPRIVDIADVTWLPGISPMDLAEAAQGCQLWYDCLMYLEMECINVLNLPKGGGGLTPLHSVSSGNNASRLIPAIRTTRNNAPDVEDPRVAQHRNALVEPLTAACRALGDTDLLKACAQYAFTSPAVSALHAQLSHDWTGALHAYDRMCSSGRNRTSSASWKRHIAACSNLLVKMGCSSAGMALTDVTSMTPNNEDNTDEEQQDDAVSIRAAAAEAAWRCGQWDAMIVSSNGNDDQQALEPQCSTIDETIFRALKAIHDKDKQSLRHALRTGQQMLLAKIVSQPASILTTLVHCQVLRELEDCAAVLGFAISETSLLLQKQKSKNAVVTTLASPVGAWMSTAIASGEVLFSDSRIPYERVELLDATRSALCHVSGDLQAWSKQVIGYVDHALAGEFVGLAKRSIEQFLDGVASLSSSSAAAPSRNTTNNNNNNNNSLLLLQRMPTIALCHAKVQMAQGNATAAIRILQDAISPLRNTNIDPEMYAEVVRKIVTWAHMAQIVPTTTLVHDSNFAEVIDSSSAVSGRTNFLMANLCDALNSELTSRLSSPDAVALAASMEESFSVLKSFQAQQTKLSERLKTLESEGKAVCSRIKYVYQPQLPFLENMDKALKWYAAAAGGGNSNESERRVMQSIYQECVELLRCHRDAHMRVQNLQKEQDRYTAERAELTNKITQYFMSAAYHFAKSLCMGTATAHHQSSSSEQQEQRDATTHAVFRMVDLLFKNPQIASNEQLSTLVISVPSQYFIPLFPQLAARVMPVAAAGVGREPNSPELQQHRTFHTFIRRIILNVSREYPHHTIWALSALANGDRWSEQEALTHHSDKDKVRLMKDVLKELSGSSPQLKQIAHSMTALSEAYLELAFVRPAKDDIGRREIAPKMQLRSQWKLFQATPVPTVSLPIDPTFASRGYKLSSDTPLVAEYHAEFEFLSGVNKPKAVWCITSRGTREKQLLKSSDDMRQDAIIEQIFRVVNTLLSNKSFAKRRSSSSSDMLRLRTYVVVPLGPSTGILQWVANTLPLTTYLVGGSTLLERGAHQRYYPNDMDHSACRDHMRSVERKSLMEKVHAYREVTSHFTPVMHKFFPEHFASPRLLYERQRAYIQSVAVASITGHLVGLGDRHISNILLDVKTAEVVLIDLGIAFDQGKLLNVPELVPFRLTRDMVDGMGIQGLEGTFRGSCEATLQIVRENKELLEIVLDAFIHDPLAKWAVDLNARALQHDEVASAAAPRTRQSAADANRTLARVRDKLRGYDAGEAYSVQGQVQKLIQESVYEENLACMYHGWSAWV